MEHLMMACGLGGTLAGLATLAIWLALGGGKLIWRLIVVFMITSGAGMLFCVASGELEAECLTLLWMVVVTITTVFLGIRWLGVRLEYASHSVA